MRIHSTMKKAFLATFASVLFGALPGSAAAATKTFFATADNYTGGSGSNSALRIDGSPVVNTWLKFNVSLPESATVTGAILSINATSSNGSGGFNVYDASNDSWTESGPGPSPGAAVSSRYPSYTTSGWKGVGLNPGVIRNGVQSFVLRTSSSTSKWFAARETGGRPNLAVTYTVSDPPPPPRDSDGDGVSDSQDQCPSQPGPTSNNGCPVSPPPSDADGDGVPDGSDQCPTQAGSASNNGCPVSSTGPVAFPADFHTSGIHPYVDNNGYDHVLVGPFLWPVWQGSEAWTASDYQAVRAAGFNSVKFNLPWAHYEPSEGNVQWLAQLDAAVQKANQAGLYVVMCALVSGSDAVPGWAASRPLDAPQVTNNTSGTGGVLFIERHRDEATDPGSFYPVIINRYKDDPGVASFDLIHETRGTNDNPALLRSGWSPMVTKLRGLVGGEPILSIGPGWSWTNMAGVDPANYTGPKGQLVWGNSDYYSGAGGPYNQFGMPQNNMAFGNVFYTGTEAGLESFVDSQRDFARALAVAYTIEEHGTAWRSSQAQVYARDYGNLMARDRISRHPWMWHRTNEIFSLWPNQSLALGVAGTQNLAKTPAPLKVE